jgi:hypothetical protein
METDKKAQTQWYKSQISYNNYMNYISKKKYKFKLDFIDLLYVSNFKGGYATINEPEKIISQKLVPYGNLFYNIESKFGGRKLNELDNRETEEIITFANILLALTDIKSKTKIDGFSASFLTTLLHFYFPYLYPILDRRILSALNIINNDDLDKQNQVKNIKRFYPTLIQNFREKTTKETIRDLDYKLFITKFMNKEKQISVLESC